MSDKKQEEKKYTILIVDDDPLIIRMYEYRLTHDGYNVILASNNEGALDKARKESPDLILLDLMMPGVNGVETLKVLKKEEGTKSIPVIILTNLGDDPAYIDLTKQIGADNFIIKAETSLTVLAEIVSKILKK